MSASNPGAPLVVNPLISSLVLAPAGMAINQLIEDDPHLAGLVEPFTNKYLEIETSQPDITISVQFEPSRIRLSNLDSATLGLHPDAKVRAPAFVLVSMLARDARSRGLVNPKLELSGDIEFVQAVLRALQRADIRWSDLLGATLGDSLSGELTKLIEAGSDWTRQSKTRMRRNVEDYLKEEIGFVPSHFEAARFAEQLHDLRLHLDRITARAQELGGRVNKLISD